MARTLSIILHAHVPYLRDPDGTHPDEQAWLFRALSESYTPALKMLRGLADEGVPFRIAVSWSPLLETMLADTLLQNRYIAWLEGEIDAADAACAMTERDPQGHFEARRERDRLVDCLKTFTHDWNRKVTGQLHTLQVAGCVERLGTAATHAWLPALADEPEMLRAQIRLGSGDRPGFWLPELGCSPEVARALSDNGVRWTVIEGADTGPVVLDGGVVGFPSDEALSRAVSRSWDGETFLARTPTVEGISVCPIDLESLGHWCRGGIRFLEDVIRGAAEISDLQLASPGDYLRAHLEYPMGSARLDGRNLFEGELLPHLAQIIRDAVAEARRTPLAANGDRKFGQLLRELLLAQASDWPFLVSAGESALGEYSKQRMRSHIARSRAILADDPGALDRSEAEIPIFPNLDWRILLSRV